MWSLCGRVKSQINYINQLDKSTLCLSYYIKSDQFDPINQTITLSVITLSRFLLYWKKRVPDRGAGMCYLSFSLSLKNTHTHTHIHTHAQSWRARWSVAPILCASEPQTPFLAAESIQTQTAFQVQVQFKHFFARIEKQKLWRNEMKWKWGKCVADCKCSEKRWIESTMKNGRWFETSKSRGN